MIALVLTVVGYATTFPRSKWEKKGTRLWPWLLAGTFGVTAAVLDSDPTSFETAGRVLGIAALSTLSVVSVYLLSSGSRWLRRAVRRRRDR